MFTHKHIFHETNHDVPKPSLLQYSYSCRETQNWSTSILLYSPHHCFPYKHIRFHMFSVLEGITRKLETLKVRTNSLHPLAAVGKRLLIGEVKNQAQQGRVTPLEKRGSRFQLMVQACSSPSFIQNSILTIFSLASTNVCFPAESIM